MGISTTPSNATSKGITSSFDSSKKTYGTYRHPAELGKSEIENNYRVIVQGRGVDFLTPIRNKMKEIILVERSRVDGESTTPVGAIKKQGPVEVRERNPMQPGRVF